MRTITTKALAVLLGWVEEQQPGPEVGSVNIICCDFVDVTYFCECVIGLNYKKAVLTETQKRHSFWMCRRDKGGVACRCCKLCIIKMYFDARDPWDTNTFCIFSTIVNFTGTSCWMWLTMLYTKCQNYVSICCQFGSQNSPRHTHRHFEHFYCEKSFELCEHVGTNTLTLEWTMNNGCRTPNELAFLVKNITHLSLIVL